MMLEILHKNETDKTPLVKFSPANGAFEIEGVSIPEDTLLFYEQVFNWLDIYLEQSASATLLSVKMKFFNTSSSKCLFTIFKKLETLHQTGRSVKIIWYYKLEDTDMFESGQDFKNLLSVPFQIERY